jgi:hypothetical protein
MTPDDLPEGLQPGQVITLTDTDGHPLGVWRVTAIREETGEYVLEPIGGLP